MTTLTERIEAAARANFTREYPYLDWMSDLSEDDRNDYREEVRTTLNEAFPEIVPAPGEQPSCWLAPWEATEAMEKAVWLASTDRENGDVKVEWTAARDAHLKEQGEQG